MYLTQESLEIAMWLLCPTLKDSQDFNQNYLTHSGVRRFRVATCQPLHDWMTADVGGTGNWNLSTALTGTKKAGRPMFLFDFCEKNITLGILPFRESIF